MKKIGLTGNIGSGKTLVSEIFKVLGIPVFNADLEAKNILDSQNVIDQLLGIFGETIVQNQKINRQVLASIVFNDRSKLDKLNSIMHPEVRKTFAVWTKNFPDSHYLIYEAAIIFESGFYKKLNATILVTAPEELRIERVKTRDNISREQVIARIKNQWTDERKAKLADYEIRNDGVEKLIPKVLDIHHKIISA